MFYLLHKHSQTCNLVQWPGVPLARQGVSDARIGSGCPFVDGGMRRCNKYKKQSCDTLAERTTSDGANLRFLVGVPKMCVLVIVMQLTQKAHGVGGALCSYMVLRAPGTSGVVVQGEDTPRVTFNARLRLGRRTSTVWLGGDGGCLCEQVVLSAPPNVRKWFLKTPPSVRAPMATRPTHPLFGTRRGGVKLGGS